MQIELEVSPEGQVVFIYNDLLADLLAEGLSRVQRVSNVEPGSQGGWIADLSPVSPGTVLGPFRLRQEALDAEVQWLRARLFKS